MSEKTHWRKYHDTDYIGAYTLLDAGVETLDITINQVVPQNVKGPDGKTEEHIVALLKDQKPMILNVTNCKMIEKVHGTPFMEEWSGKSVTLYVTKIRAFGDTVDALRIKDKAPSVKSATTTKDAPAASDPSKEVLNEDHEKWNGAKDALAKKSVTLAAIKKKYTLSKEDEEKLAAKD